MSPDPASKGLRADARTNRARILATAAELFAEKGPAATTEEIAARAGVAVGTVFRHFPTKDALLQSIMKDLRLRLAEEAQALAGTDPAEALFEFFGRLVGAAASTRTVVDLLAETGHDVDVTGSLQILHDNIDRLLVNAQQAGSIRADVHLDEVNALLTASCQGALHGRWSPELQQRTLSIIFTGLRPPPPDRHR
jgi:AcrR family transcriptional regulator